MSMRHKVGAFIVAGVLISLCVTIFTGLTDGYNLTETNTQNGRNVMEELNNLNLIQGMNKIGESFTKIISPDNPLDMLGALATVGIGLLQTVGGILLLPFKIIGIITNFYPGAIPAIIPIFLGAMLVVYVGFVILSAITRTDL